MDVSWIDAWREVREMEKEGREVDGEKVAWCIEEFQKYLVESMQEEDDGEEDGLDVREVVAQVNAVAATKVYGFSVSLLTSMHEDGIEQEPTVAFIGDSDYFGENLLHVLLFRMDTFRKMLEAGEEMIRMLEGRDN